MLKDIHDVLGLIAAVLIVASMVFKTTTFKGTILMRIINALGSVFFIIYGFWPQEDAFLGVFAFATGIANAALFLLNIFYIYKETKDHNIKKTT